jgi:hypothetical protein
MRPRAPRPAPEEDPSVKLTNLKITQNSAFWWV